MFYSSSARGVDLAAEQKEYPGPDVLPFTDVPGPTMDLDITQDPPSMTQDPSPISGPGAEGLQCHASLASRADPIATWTVRLLPSPTTQTRPVWDWKSTNHPK